MILLDTSGVIAALFPDQRGHEQCATVLRDPQPRRILSPFVLTELDYLIQQEAGTRAELLFLEDVARGAYELATFVQEDVAEAVTIVRTYHDLNIGLADASIVVLANRYDCRDLLTLDERHFRALRWRGKPFRILPTDA